MQVLYLVRAPRTKETLPDFLKWSRVTRRPLVFHGLTGSQRTLRFWGVTKQLLETMCGGDFLCKHPDEAMDFLNYVAGTSKAWDEPNPREAERLRPSNHQRGACMHFHKTQR